MSSAPSAEKHALFPIFLKLASRRCLVLGAGKTAEEKIPTLLACGAAVTVVAPEATPKIKRWAGDEKLYWSKKRFESPDLDGIFLAVIATSSKTVNRAAFQEAQQRGILCNVVRDRSYCDFPPATAGPLRNVCAKSWNASLGRSGKIGCAGWVRSVHPSMKIRYHLASVAPCCTSSPARKRKRKCSAAGGCCRRPRKASFCETICTEGSAIGSRISLRP